MTVVTLSSNEIGSPLGDPACSGGFSTFLFRAGHAASAQID
jgi:hypothetical protein